MWPVGMALVGSCYSPDSEFSARCGVFRKKEDDSQVGGFIK